MISCFSNILFSQLDTIHLMNPSFEDYPMAGNVPIGWKDCGFPGESPADTHPSGQFAVTKYAADGNTYLGLVTRDNDTWEMAGQKLTEPMIAGQCYIFKLTLCRSELYVSPSRETNTETNYVDPIKLKIWGGNSFCDKKETLGETPVVDHSDWDDYVFTIAPDENHRFILLEAFYQVPVIFPYNGNLLIDNASPIIPVSCDSIATWSLDRKAAILSGTKDND